MATEVGTQAVARSKFSAEMLFHPAYAVGMMRRCQRRLRLAGAISAFQNQRRRSFCCTSASSKPPRCQEVPSSVDKLVESLERRSWMLRYPGAEIHRITLTAPTCPREELGEGKQRPSDQPFQEWSYSNSTKPLLGESFREGGGDGPSFYVVRDDLLHPLINGNKARKLDAVLPVLQRYSITDVVTCGGCQSAHTAAVAVSCAERGIRSHLLLRGEPPETLTGYNLVSHMYGNVTYVPRSLYAKREEMLRVHADVVAADLGSVLLLDDHNDAFLSTFDCHVNEGDNFFQINNSYRRVAIINEGAANTTALLGVFRLVHYLSQPHVFGRHPVKIILDAGTGVTAIGFGLAVKYLGLPWETTAVMLADAADTYRNREKKLISDFTRLYGLEHHNSFSCSHVNNNVQWIGRIYPRRFGKVLEGEIRTCQEIAQQTGVLLDPIYTLAAWEHASLISQKEPDSFKVVMLHTGGTLGLFGLAQRYRASFLKEDEQ